MRYLALLVLIGVLSSFGCVQKATSDRLVSGEVEMQVIESLLDGTVTVEVQGHLPAGWTPRIGPEYIVFRLAVPGEYSMSFQVPPEYEGHPMFHVPEDFQVSAAVPVDVIKQYDQALGLSPWLQITVERGDRQETVDCAGRT